MPEADRALPLRCVLGALLVAADQRCPAIIGQAHLLYYGAFDRPPAELRRRLGELKREAVDLCEAIAVVEAALRTTGTADSHTGC